MVLIQLFPEVLTDLFIAVEIALAQSFILFKLIVDDCVLSFDCLLLVLQKSVLHGEFVQLTTIVNCLLATLFRFKVDISVDRISFLFEHSNVGLFFPNNFLDGLSLHIFVIS
jgi:hypothetical protein